MTKTIKQLIKDAPTIRVRIREQPPHLVKVPFEWLEHLLIIHPFEAFKLIVWLRDADLYGNNGSWRPVLNEISRLVAPRLNLELLSAEYGTIDAAFHEALETNKQELSL